MADYYNIQSNEDLLVEILARLPVKSLIRFICVCKYWQSLITSPSFSKTHYATRLRLLRNQTQTEDNHDSLLSTFANGCSISIFEYEDLSYKTTFKFRPYVDVPKPLRFGVCHCHVISDCNISGPCNGLFLVTLRKGLHELVLLIWNPATRRAFKVPYVEGIGYCNGFGFDSKTNDFKVVSFNGTRNKGGVVLVYSLTANAWRQVDAGFRFGNFDMSMGGDTCTTNNGGMHHWTICDVRYLREYLVSFDMVHEVFVETPMPSSYLSLMKKGSNHMYPLVYESDNRNDPTGINIWMVKEYGRTGSWVKLQYIALPREVMGFGSSLLMWRNNEGIIYVSYTEGQGGLCCFNLTTKEVKVLGVPSELWSFIGYTESLFSVTNFAQHQQPPFVYQNEAECSTLGTEDHVDDAADDDDGDDDDSSTDSAFITPEGALNSPYDEIYVDCDEDAESCLRKENECQRLSKLPYCFREVNQPISYNTCLF